MTTALEKEYQNRLAALQAREKGRGKRSLSGNTCLMKGLEHMAKSRGTNLSRFVETLLIEALTDEEFADLLAWHDGMNESATIPGAKQ